MMIISKKRIQIIILCIIISIFTFSLSKSKKEITNNNNIIQTTATPVSGKTIIIDAGHGTPDERS